MSETKQDLWTSVTNVNTKTIIFDFDGVILDSANIKTEAFLELFNDYPEHQKSIKDYHIEHQGITRYTKFKWIYTELLNKPYDQETKEKLGKKFSDIVFNKVMESEPIPGAIEFLKSIQGKLPAYISSGTPDEELHRIISKRNLSQYFEEVYGSNISKEEAIDRIAQDKSLEYSELLFVGDATTDYNAANSRNVKFIAVYSDEMQGFWNEKNIKPIKNLMEIKNRVEKDL